MLEKIGLPAKPSLRGNNWVVDATHCQGCSSQFTFINRKHHCRRCGGLFCGCCTQQRMYLRGQGDSPVRICDPCKTLEEAARFEMRHGHKNKSGRGTSKLVSNNEDDVLNKILADGGNESVPSDQDSVDFLSSVERATSSASTSNSNMGSTSPEELRLQAVEEKKKYKTLKAEGKPEEALRAFKRGKELERQAGALEIKLRKNRRKALSSTMINENKKIEDAKRPKEKDDLANELRELGWSDLDLRDADRKPATMTLEGELSTLLKEASQKTNSNTEKGNVSIDKSEVVALKKRALTLKREGKLTEAKEELKRAKILEKQIEERELLGDSDDSDDGFSSLIRSMDIDKEDISATGNNWKRNVDFDYLLRMDDGVGIDSNFEVTDEDLDDPEMSAALQSLGWTEDTSQPTPDRGAILSEIQSLKRDALSKKRAGGTAEALALLRKAKALEADIGNDDDTEESGCLVNSSVSSTSKPDVDYKMPPKSKLAIQRELLVLKKKALALRREGRVDKADQELMKGKALEQQLEELEKGPKVKSAQVNVNERVAEFSAPMDVEDEGEDVTDTDMNDPSYLSLLQNLGWQDEDNEKGQVVELEAPKQETVSSRKSKAEIQRELLGLKRKSLALRRQGNIDEAEEVLKMSKGLEAQLAEMEAPKQEMNVDETYGASSLKIAGEKTVVSEVPLDEKPETGIKEEVVAVKSVGERKVVSEVSFDEKPQIGNKEELVGVNESSSIKQEILALKRKAVSLKREGKLAEAKEELRHAKLLEKKIMDIEEKSSVSGMSKLNSSDIVATVGTKDQNDSPAPKLPMKSNSNSSDVTPIGKKDQHEISPPKLSSRDRFKLQQESLSHKRQALKLRREGRTAEAEAEFELAKNLESQLEELNAAQESSKPEGLVDDVGIEDLLDPQLLSALREIGIEGTAGGLSQYPEKAEPVKHQQAVNKTENSNEERMQLEEQIKAEKVKAVNLKRSGKQAEALDALRRAKLFEKKLNSLASS